MLNYYFTSKSFDWGTPEWLIKEITLSLGGLIDLDPCSSEKHNQVVKAQKIYTEKGLEQPWVGTIFVNHPGERTGKNSRNWWKKFNESSQTCTRMCWLDFNPNRLFTLEPSPLELYNSTTVLIRKRVAYIGASTQPPMNSWLVFSNPITVENFRQYGSIIENRKNGGK